MPTKISEMTQETNVADGDLVEILDQSVPATRSAAVQDLVRQRSCDLHSTFAASNQTTVEVPIPDREVVEVVLTKLEVDSAGEDAWLEVFESGVVDTGNNYEWVLLQDQPGSSFKESSDSGSLGVVDRIKLAPEVTVGDGAEILSCLRITTVRPHNNSRETPFHFRGFVAKDGSIMQFVRGSGRHTNMSTIDKLNFLAADNAGNTDMFRWLEGFVLSWDFAPL